MAKLKIFMQRSELTSLGGVRNWARDGEAGKGENAWGVGSMVKTVGTNLAPLFILLLMTEYNLRMQPLGSLLSMSKEASMWLPPPHSFHRPLGA